jgi:hypothetical protein
MRGARLLSGALAGLAALTMAACSSSSTAGSGQADTSAASTSPTQVVSSAASSSAASSSAAVTAASSAAPIATGATPPSGDASVHFGQTSLVALTNFATDKTDPIRLTISMKPGSLADLSGFDLDAQTKQGTPFYVSYALTNLSTKKIDSSGFAGRLTVSNASGDEASTITLLGDFPKCEGSAPDKLAPGASGHGCDVYVVPRGQKVAKVEISNGSDGHITWS